MYGICYTFRHYIAILRERFYCRLRDAQLRSSRQNIVDGRVVSSDVVCTHVTGHNTCICWFFTRILLGILIFKGLIARRLYKSFGVNGLITLKSL
jgi:hypothetical protein